MREQTGAVTSPSHDNHKARRAQKGGVMASVFTGKSHHNEMTFELSLEINRKMQSVLEDALLKNIMLKVSCVCWMVVSSRYHVCAG